MDIKIKKINFEVNILKVIKATVTEMRGINNHQKYDFDLYQIEALSPMSTREITLTVDFIEKKVSGDIIAFGDWYDLDIESVNEILKQFKKGRTNIKNNQFYLKKYQKKENYFSFF
ncbi:hypothetical protein [Enterococcus gallinarum]|uniref:hypothetical protein n=1 Tax=Enterococcus gallinarum TaxID=1353 RepID=UPI001E381E93|nr:hypothetical protein [Enterococcus gallinarum]